MGTAQKLGLDHWRFEAMAEELAARYVGKPHSVIVAMTPYDTPARLHVQDGHTPGGFVIGLLPGDSIPAQMQPAVVPPALSYTGEPPATPVLVDHELGYPPLVQVMNAAGQILAEPDVSVMHFDENTLEVTVAAGGDFTIILR